MNKHTKENSTSRYILERYPILESVPPNERQRIIKKAVMHPATILFALLCGFIILPMYLTYVPPFFGLDENNQETMTLVKLFVVVAIPFFLLFYFLRQVLMPWCMKRIIKKLGFAKKEE